ncbi:phosphate signaling complex protein PhoU [Hathewaya histolytica]|uniref:Phosphate-specific transport system accessory protein PhoU n=1 Tax=Hathewaya histolytica TaxID=1498 RepID=A0A4U9RN18_HATHI|nr:phosphate signaling complex protein PhoU [Hathewaya histolytica]VTQ90270.1 phosphate transporter protein [Hathewaya histolytica]
MVRTSFDTSLQELHNHILRMGSIVEKQIYNSVKSLIDTDIELADKVIKNDDLVDTAEKEIEDMAIKLIATQQPLAVDLRDIFTTTKIVTDLERIADHAVDISKITKKLIGESYIKELIFIPKIAYIVNNMVKDSLDAYVQSDVHGAYEVCKRDDEVDALYKSVFKEMVEVMGRDVKYTNQATQFLFVCKFLERIADHATNICEWTIYMVTGKQVDLNE